MEIRRSNGINLRVLICFRNSRSISSSNFFLN